MAYENLRLVVAALSGDIYLARMNKSGFMGESRRIISEECLRASTEWFMSNKKSMIRYETLPSGEVPHLFYTADKDVAERIQEIIEEGKPNDSKM